MNIIKAEPVAIAAFLGIAINLAISFGLHLTQEQVALINALIVAGLALLVRQNVFAPDTTQALVNRAAVYGTTDIGTPPDGSQ